MPTIHEMLDQVIAYSRQTIALALALKGEAPAEEAAPPAPPAPSSKYINGMSAPDAIGRVELELVDKLRAEFGAAPNGYKIPSLWFVPGVVVSHLSPSVQGDYQMNVGGAGLNLGLAYTYKDQRVWFGTTARVKDAVIPDTLCWNQSLADLEAALRDRIRVLATYPPYSPDPKSPETLRSVDGYVDLKKPV